MEKLCRSLQWISEDQATRWLEDMTGEPIKHRDFFELCEVLECPVYLDCRDWNGKTTTGAAVIGAGYSTVDSPAKLYEDGPDYVTGPARMSDTGRMDEKCKWWFEYDESRRPRFNSSDIAALAAKMNGEDEQPSDRAAQLEDLRQKLELERRGHYIAVDESLGLRDELEQERYARQAAEDRLFKLRQNLNDEDNPKQVAEAAALQQELAQERRARAEMEAVTKDLRQQLERARERYKADRVRIMSGQDMEGRLSTTLAVAHRDLAQLGQKLEQEQAIRASIEQQLQAEDKAIDKRERATFERLLYVLAREAGYRIGQPYADEELIKQYADTIGAKVPTGKGKIAEKLKSAAARFDKDRDD